MAGDKETLLSMGFDPARVEWALRATSNTGLQPAMDHILEHEAEPVPDPSAQSSQSDAAKGTDDPMDEDEDAFRAVYGVGNTSSAADLEAKSIKCSECGKIFKNTALANFHAEKSGHDQFEESTEEIKPLTEEEKKVKMEELRSKLAEKRARKAKEELEENKANELIKRKAGKEMGKIKEDMKQKEAIKAAEQMRRDKEEDAKARAAIKAQIEADKKLRAEKAAREKAMRDGGVVEATPAAQSTPTPAPASTSSSTPGKEYKETRLQIRLASGGQPLVTSLPSESTLQEVAEFVAGQSLTVDSETVTFRTNFPKKQFTRADHSKTLRDLGLTPSAVLFTS